MAMTMRHSVYPQTGSMRISANLDSRSNTNNFQYPRTDRTKHGQDVDNPAYPLYNITSRRNTYKGGN